MEKQSPALFILLLVLLPFIPIAVKFMAAFFSMLSNQVMNSILTTGVQTIDTPILIGKYLLYYLLTVLSNENVLYILLALGVIYAAAEAASR